MEEDAEYTRGEAVCAFIETYCVIPEGDLIGQPMLLEPFQRDFIIDVFDNPEGTRLGIMSTGRKNAKSTTIAAIGLACTVGPEAVQNSQIVVGARSREQAGIIFKAASKMIMLSPILSELTHIVPSGKTIRGRMKNVELRTLAADAGTAHGLSPRIAIMDELGQVRGPKDAFYEAIATSQGAYDDAIMFAISTQASDDNDLFSIMLDDAVLSKDPNIVVHLHSAPPDCDLDDEEGWRLANPAIGKFRSYKDVKAQSLKAMRLPSEEASFRQLILNQRVEKNNPYISKSVWMEGKEAPKPFGDREVWYGLDLSSSESLSALVGIAIDDIVPSAPVIDVQAYHWVPGNNIEEKSKLDRVPYDLWQKEGFIKSVPGHSVDYDFVAYELIQRMETENVVAVAFDRWNIKSFMAAMERMGATESHIQKMRQFGQGYASFSPALRALDEYILNGRVRHGNNPVLNYCMSSATIKQDPAGNRKLDKSHRTKRIDGAVALAMATGISKTEQDESFDPLSMIG